MKVLLTNDDGIKAQGIRALYTALKEAGHEARVVAPMGQQSGVSHSLTVFEPLRAEYIKIDDYEGTGIYGTPTDCVKVGLGQLMDETPDLVMAGINDGPNVGPDIFYSGTVGGAAEGAHSNVPSMAVSHAGAKDWEDFLKAARHAVALAEKINWKKMPPRRVININYPPCAHELCKGIKICPQSPAVWSNDFNEHNDPRGAPYWWLNGVIDKNSLGEDSDRHLLFHNYITITPLKFEYTAEESLPILRNMGLEK